MEPFIPLNMKKEEVNEKKPQPRKDWHNKDNKGNANKKGRIVIRNLPYKAEEDDISKLFKPYGELVELKILTFDDGRKKGVAFLQYNNLLSAMKAIKECNMKKLMGRPIAVDLAVSKDRYRSVNPKTEDVKVKDDSIMEIKTETNEEKDGLHNKLFSEGIIPVEKIKKEKDDTEIKEETSQDVKEEDLSDEEEEEVDCDIEDASDEDDDDDDDEDESDVEDDSKPKVKKEKSDSELSHNTVSKDVLEGRTLFIKALSSDVLEEDVSDLLSQFGKLKYVIFCKDKFTQRFRGTAFAQFLEKSSCDRCLDAFNDPAYKSTFRLGGRFFTVSPAVGREDITKRGETKVKEKEPQDKRNLYLAREGVIRGGTQPAIGVSKSDLALRVVRERIKRKMLVNFNIFMSPTRLYVCNLPLELTDNELRNIFKKYSPKGAFIKECRIMKNLLECDRKGNPVSKGHGFVAFKEHSHAIEALRSINNNPEIFSRDKRPIVEFSMENKAALKAKEMRLQKSKEGNKRKRQKEESFTPNHNVVASSSKSEMPKFMGSNYDPNKKGAKAFHTHIGPKIRHKDGGKKSGKITNKQSGKITRNKVNNQLRNSSFGKRKKNNQKLSKKSSKSNKKSKKTQKQSNKKGPKTKKKQFI